MFPVNLQLLFAGRVSSFCVLVENILQVATTAGERYWFSTEETQKTWTNPITPPSPQKTQGWWFKETAFCSKSWGDSLRYVGRRISAAAREQFGEMGLSVLLALPADNLKRLLLCSWEFPLITAGVRPQTTESPEHHRWLINHRGKNTEGSGGVIFLLGSVPSSDAGPRVRYGSWVRFPSWGKMTKTHGQLQNSAEIFYGCSFHFWPIGVFWYCV